MPAQTVAEAYRAACLAELDALKPGNVHRYAAGHGMQIADFITSAEVSAPLIAAPGAPVGDRIFNAVRATRDAVGQNTNLGIILLCAPLAAAFENKVAGFHSALSQTLKNLTMADAEQTFAAIALANPGGLGAVDEGDVRTAPPLGLLEAMRLAAARDMIAAQYATDFHEIFSFGVPRANGASLPDAAQRVYLAFAAAFADSHVGRKYGDETARRLMRRFQDITAKTPDEAALLRFDAELKAQQLNPGTSADLTVASLFAALLQEKYPKQG